MYLLFKVFIWLFILVGISFLLGSFWGKFFSGKKFRIILLPGVMVHELSHILGCLITGAGIIKAEIFSSRGSYVSHTKPRLPLIGNFIISFSPIVGGIAALVVLLRIFGYEIFSGGLAFQPLFDSFFFFIGEIFRFFLNEYKTWQFWFFAYLTLSIVICLVPSKQDLKNSFLSAAFVFVLFFTFLHFKIFDSQIIFFLNNYVINVLATGVFFGLLAFFVTFPAYIIKKLI